LRTVGIGAGISGIALLGAGVACMMVANGKLDRLEADAAGRRPYNEANGNWQTFQAASIVLYATGGAALVGGVAAYFVGRSSSSDGNRGEASLFVAPALRGVTLGGTF
jgi:hypothetical protein